MLYNINEMTKAYLEPDDVDKLIRAGQTLRDQLLLRMLCRLGCRISEVITIEPSDIDFNQKLITVQHLKRRFHLSCPQCGTKLSKSHLFCPKCGNPVAKVVSKATQHEYRRRVKIDSETLYLIKEYLTKRTKTRRNSKLFSLTRQTAYNIVRGAAQRAGLGGRILDIEGMKQPHYVSPHRLRDSFAITWLQKRDDLLSQRMLQQQLGHQNFDTTMKYRKISGQELGEVYDAIWEK